MKILYLTAGFPYPPNSGYRIRSFHLLKALANQGQVTLICGLESPEDGAHLEVLKRYSSQVTFVRQDSFWYYQADRKQKKSMKNRLLQLLAMRPWSVQSFVSESMRKTLLEVKPDRFDLIVIRDTPLAQYFFDEESLRSCVRKMVVDIDDVTLRQQERQVRAMKFGYRKIRHALDLSFLRRYYKKLHRALGLFVCSELDREYLIRRGFSRVFVIPNAIEMNGHHASMPPDAGASPELLFCGLLSYGPNAEGIRYFAERIFQKIRQAKPEVRLTIIGRCPGPEVLALQSIPGISVEGEVSSLAPYYQRAAVCVVPLLDGAGTRIKILEAFAYKRPVVSTSIGAEGLEVTDGKEILLADDPDLFARRCVELLDDPTKRTALASSGYQFVREKYQIEVFNRRMNEFFDEVRQNHARRPTRVLIAESGSGFGGSAKYLAQLVPLLDPGQFNIQIAAAAEGPFIAQIREQGIRVHLVPQWRFPWRENLLVEAMQMLLLVPRIVVWLARRRIRLVHLNNEILSHLPLVLAGRLAGCRLICHLHGWRPLTRIERLAARYVDEFVSVTHSGARYYSQQMKGRRVIGIPNGLAPNGSANGMEEARRRLRMELGIQEDETLISTIGRLIPMKGHAVFLEALAQTLRHRPRARGLIVGHDPSPGHRYRQELEELSRKLGVADQVRFLPWSGKIAPLYAATDLVVQASVEPESFGFVVLEAMAAGKPVIASRMGGLVDLVIDGETGFLVEPAHVGELAGAMTRLVDDRPLGDRLGEKARERARTEFAMDRNVAAVRAVYESLSQET